MHKATDRFNHWTNKRKQILNWQLTIPAKAVQKIKIIPAKPNCNMHSYRKKLQHA
jgi:hypothetical protein